MLKWNSTAAKIIVAFSLVTLSTVAATEAIILALVSRHSSEAAKQPQTASARELAPLPVIPPQTRAFHGSGPLGAVHVPFRLDNGIIEINARINGKPTECIVDTGSPIVFWVSWLHLTDQRTGLESSIGDAGSHTGHVQEAILDTVEIGGLKLHNLPSYAVAASRQSSARPTLGNSAFAHTVITFDYARRELIIQPSVPNSVPAGVQDRSHVLDFRWLNSDARGEAGVPCVRGTVMSQPATMTIDTGWFGDGSIALSHSFYDQIRPQIQSRHIKVREKTINVVMGTTGVLAVSHVSWSLGGITQVSPALTVNSLASGVQAVVTPYLLKNFRITIDYPQQKIWFDPIQPDVKPADQTKRHSARPQKA